MRFVKPLRVSLLMACLMLAAAVAGVIGRPPPATRGAAQKFSLEDMVPRQFGRWHEVQPHQLQIVNPQTQQLLDKLYSQLLSRSYVNDSGERIMLSIAYGDDQRGTLQAHKPEVCYPAQGFTLLSSSEADLATPYGPLAVRRLNTQLGPRMEPVSYWFTMGHATISSKLQQRMIELRLALTGQIPDGLLVRISSIDASPSHAYAAHDAFASDLLAAVSVSSRARLTGLGAKPL